MSWLSDADCAGLCVLDNETWVEVTCASLEQVLLEASCCSIISLAPCHGTCVAGMLLLRPPWS